MIKFVILHDVFFGQGPRLLNISNHVLKLLVISKHGIYDLYVLRVLAEQCPEQAEGALDLIGNAPVIVLVLVIHLKFYPVASRCLSPLL